MNFPAYWKLQLRQRLELVRRGEAGEEYGAIRFHLWALNWIKTGKSSPNG